MSRYPVQSSIDRYVQRNSTRPNNNGHRHQSLGLLPVPSFAESSSGRTEITSKVGQQHFLRSLGGSSELTNAHTMAIPMKRAASNANDASRSKIPATSSSGDRPSEAPDKSNESQLRVVTGSVDHVLHWRKIFPQLIALWEVYAIVLRVQNGTAPGEKLLLLRNGESGPVMQGFFFEIDFKLADNVSPGSTVRCVGRFVGNGCRFQLFKVRRLPNDESAYGELVSRLSALCNFALTKSYKSSKLSAVL